MTDPKGGPVTATTVSGYGLILHYSFEKYKVIDR